MGKDTSLVDALFGGVTARLWALASKVEGTYEFDVPPVREYFAARYLYAYAGTDSARPQKSEILQHLIRRPHWVNTCRFYAGFANPNEISGLAEGLEEEIELGRHPREARLVGWALLGDGVFAARPRTQQRAERLFVDDLSIRLICQELDSRPGNRQLPGDKAAASLAAALREAVAAEPTAPLNAERLQLAAHLLPDRASFDAWWQPHMETALGADEEGAWLRAAVTFQGGQRLTAGQVSRLKLTKPDVAAAALEAGVVPPPGSPTEAQLVHAVLSGSCSDAAVTTAGYAGDILRLLSPHHFLRKATRGQLTYTLDAGHNQPGMTDQQRQSAFNRLKARDARFGRIQAASRTGRGQARTTSVWGNTAREVSQLFGPCWIAAEIAIIGAASPDDDFRTEGDVTPGSSPFSEHPDYGRLLQELRFNRSHGGWWKSQFEAHADSLSRSAWLLGLVAVADEKVVIDCLDQLASGLQELPPLPLQALCLSSSRIGVASEVGRPLEKACLEKAATASPLSWLLVAHHAADVNNLGVFSGPSDQELASLAEHGAAAWPAACALTTRMMTNPTSTTLACLRRHGARAFPHGEFLCDGIPTQLLQEVLANPAEFPLGWVLGAEQAISASVKEPPLADIADQQGWFT
jgi:hypothetical protein